MVVTRVDFVVNDGRLVFMIVFVSPVDLLGDAAVEVDGGTEEESLVFVVPIDVGVVLLNVDNKVDLTDVCRVVLVLGVKVDAFDVSCDLAVVLKVVFWDVFVDIAVV